MKKKEQREMVNAIVTDARLRDLLHHARALIQQDRQRALKEVDRIQVHTCWEIATLLNLSKAVRIVRSTPKDLVRQLAQALTSEFGKGFDASNLWQMCGFFSAFPIIDALRRELSWTHYRTLLRVDDESVRLWYMNEAAAQSWSTWALERQIGTLYDERLLGSSDRKAVEREATDNLAR